MPFLETLTSKNIYIQTVIKTVMKKICIVALSILLTSTISIGAIPRPKNAKLKNARVVRIDNKKVLIPIPQPGKR